MAPKASALARAPEPDAASAKGPSKLSIEGCRKSFPGARNGAGRVDVLSDITLKVEAGEVVSIIGPSGCGKTTLLRIVSGLAAPDAGAILVDGRPLTEPSSVFSIVFQDVRVLPWKTVRENVAFALELKYHRRLGKDENEEVEYYLQAVGLKDFLHAYPHQLSGGMRQRVGVARAMVRKPQILLLDEPFGSLDAQTRMLMQDLFLSLHAKFNLTSVLITHDIDEAVYMSDRCFVLTPRPSSIRAVVPIGLPKQRVEADARSIPDFVRYRSELWNLLPHVMPVTD